MHLDAGCAMEGSMMLCQKNILWHSMMFHGDYIKRSLLTIMVGRILYITPLISEIKNIVTAANGLLFTQLSFSGAPFSNRMASFTLISMPNFSVTSLSGRRSSRSIWRSFTNSNRSITRSKYCCPTPPLRRKTQGILSEGEGSVPLTSLF
jgi:hypothetical protein